MQTAHHSSGNFIPVQIKQHREDPARLIGLVQGGEENGKVIFFENHLDSGAVKIGEFAFIEPIESRFSGKKFAFSKLVGNRSFGCRLDGALAAFRKAKIVAPTSMISGINPDQAKPGERPLIMMYEAICRGRGPIQATEAEALATGDEIDLPLEVMRMVCSEFDDGHRAVLLGDRHLVLVALRDYIQHHAWKVEGVQISSDTASKGIDTLGVALHKIR